MSKSHLGPDKTQTGPDYDPVNLMTQIFTNIEDFLGPAQDVLLSWLLRLPVVITPDDAAKKVMSEIIDTVIEPSQAVSPEGRKLIELLRQTSMHKMKSNQSSGVDRRRGGRAARLKS